MNASNQTIVAHIDWATEATEVAGPHLYFSMNSHSVATVCRILVLLSCSSLPYRPASSDGVYRLSLPPRTAGQRIWYEFSRFRK